MITTTMHYPGDPPQIIFLMFGREFIDYVRKGKPVEITITEFDGFLWPGRQDVVKVEEIFCDQCARVILPEDPLAFTGVPSKVYCWPCHENLNGPHLVRRE